MFAADSRRSFEAARAQGDCNIELILYTKMNLNNGEGLCGSDMEAMEVRSEIHRVKVFTAY